MLTEDAPESVLLIGGKILLRTCIALLDQDFADFRDLIAGDQDVQVAGHSKRYVAVYGGREHRSFERNRPDSGGLKQCEEPEQFVGLKSGTGRHGADLAANFIEYR